MTWNQILDNLPEIGITAGLVQLGNYLNTKRKLKTEDKKTIFDIERDVIETDLKSFELLKQTWKEEFERYEDRFQKLWVSQVKLESELEALKLENEDLKNQLIQIRALRPDMPIPMWLKDTTGKMLSLNQAYEDVFLFPLGKTRKDYIGNYDEDIWGEQIAEIFRSNDIIVTSQKSFVEISNEDLKNPLLNGWTFYKYPVYSHGQFIGIAGLGLPTTKKTLSTYEIK